MAPPQCSDPCLGISPFSAASPLALTSPPHQSPCFPLAGTTCIPEPTWRTGFSCWLMNLLWMDSICHTTQLSSLQLPSPYLSRSYGPLQVLAGEILLHCWVNGEALAPWLSSDPCRHIHSTALHQSDLLCFGITVKTTLPCSSSSCPN